MLRTHAGRALLSQSMHEYLVGEINNVSTSSISEISNGIAFHEISYIPNKKRDENVIFVMSNEKNLSVRLVKQEFVCIIENNER